MGSFHLSLVDCLSLRMTRSVSPFIAGHRNSEEMGGTRCSVLKSNCYRNRLLYDRISRPRMP